MQSQIICRLFCPFFQAAKTEAETCLASELLTAWCRRQPGLEAALEAAGPADREAALELLGRPFGRGRQLTVFLREQLCRVCVFRRHGCDFAQGVAAALPCGGFLALLHLLGAHAITQGEIAAAWKHFLAQAYLRLGEHVVWRSLETPHLYDRLADELYELNESAGAWLLRCDGTTPGLALQAEAEFLDSLLTESLLACLASPARRSLGGRQSPLPSLRYLEVLLTGRCNLYCRHCYLGEGGEAELSLDTVLAVLREFQDLQGLRVLLSGGEPLLYRHWEELNERLPDFELRFVLLTNGLLLSDDVIAKLQVHEVQLSLDGLAPGHDLIRGKGTWRRTVARLEALLAAGKSVSISTMIHRGNLAELPRLHTWLQSLGIREWSLDIPCPSGRLIEHQDIWVDPLEGAPYLELGFGGSEHGGSEGYACGRHLLAVLPNGTVAKCGLYRDQPLGHLAEGLETCWLRLPQVRLEDLACAPCPYLAECRGGCRFRAGGLKPDPVMCARYGVDPGDFHWS